MPKAVEIRDSENDYESIAIEFCTDVHSDDTKHQNSFELKASESITRFRGSVDVETPWPVLFEVMECT